MTSMIDQSSLPPYRYRISGLNVESDIALPMRVALDSDVNLPIDATLRLGEVPEQLEKFRHRGANWYVDDDRFLLTLPETGRFLVTGGRHLTLQPASNLSVDDILVFATGVALAALMYQRGGALLLHGSAVTHNGRAFVFCGQSGAGKSTLAGALTRIGCGFLADDICAVESADDGAPLIQPDGRLLRLYPDSIGHIGLEEAVGPRVRAHVKKFHVTVPMRGSECVDGVPLAAVYMLADANPALPPGITALTPVTAAQALLQESYRRRLALAYSSQCQLMARTAAILSHVKVYRLVRPRDFSKLDDTVTELRAHWNQLS